MKGNQIKPDTAVVMYNASHEVQINEFVQIKIIHTMFIPFTTNMPPLDKIDLDLGVDVAIISLLGKPVGPQKYSEYQSTVQHLSGLGIDLNKEIDDFISNLNVNEVKQQILDNYMNEVYKIGMDKAYL
jgi:hypothetical protein